MQLYKTGEMNFKGCQVPLQSVAWYLCNNICVLPADVLLKVPVRMAFVVFRLTGQEPQGSIPEKSLALPTPAPWPEGPDHYPRGPLVTPADFWSRLLRAFPHLV